MTIRIGTALVSVMTLVSLACGFALAGEVIVVTPVPGGASASPDTAQTNRNAAIDNALKAQEYSDPSKTPRTTTVIILPQNGPNSSTADKNREALLRSRLRANGQSQGKEGNRSGNTLVILPGTPAGTPDSRSSLDRAMDRAHSYSDGDGGRRPCTNATVSVGTVGNVVVVDRSGDPTSTAQGVNTVAVGGCR